MNSTKIAWAVMRLLSKGARLISRLPGMPDRKYNDPSAIVTVKDDIAARAEPNHPFPELRWHLLNAPAGLGILFQDSCSFADRGHGALCGVSVL